MSDDASVTLSFQGELGAYSHQACLAMLPEANVLPCETFEQAIEAVEQGRADRAVLPIENSTYGRVADIHSLLPKSSLHIVAEHFVRVNIAVMAPSGATLEQLDEALSHPVLLGQCQHFLQAHGIKPIAVSDTAGAAKQVAQEANPRRAALASAIAAEYYNLSLLADQVEDLDNNTTRFLMMSPQPSPVQPHAGQVVTAFVFTVNNRVGSLYKVLGAFATNGINMVKLESYMDNSFSQTQFYAEAIGHPDEPHVSAAFDEMTYYCSALKQLGVFRADPRRLK